MQYTPEEIRRAMQSITENTSHAVHMSDRELSELQRVLTVPVLIGLAHMSTGIRPALETMIILGIEIGYSIREHQEKTRAHYA